MRANVSFAAVLLLGISCAHAAAPGAAARSASRAIMAGAKISALRAPPGTFNADCLIALDDEGLAPYVQPVFERELRAGELVAANAFFASPAGRATTAQGVDQLYAQIAPDLEHTESRPPTAEQERLAEAFGATATGRRLSSLMEETGPMKAAVMPAAQRYFERCIARPEGTSLRPEFFEQRYDLVVGLQADPRPQEEAGIRAMLSLRARG